MIDLFAGVGGFHYGLKGYAECVFVSEKDEKAQVVYKANHLINKINSDITLVPLDMIPEHDILCAGFPCQPFSLAGNQNGFNDSRGTLFFNIMEILENKKPRVCFLENVKNLVSHDKGNTFRVILDLLKSIGYHTKYKVMNTTQYGNLPHNRERIYIVSFRDKDDYDKFDFPDKITSENNIDNILDFSEKNLDKYYQTNLNSPSVIKMHEGITEKYQIYQYRRYYVRLNKKGVCPTLTANMGTGGHNVPLVMDDHGIRKLTPRECFILQGYGKDFILPNRISDAHLYKMAGNTVSIPVVRRISENIMVALDE